MSQVTCRTCGGGCEEEDVYCAYCGVSLPGPCPRCGWDGDEDDYRDAMFCPQCGRPFVDGNTLGQLGLERHDEEEDAAKDVVLKKA